MTEKRPTVGKIVSDLMLKEPDKMRVVDLTSEVLHSNDENSYFNKLIKKVQAGKNIFPNSDFFIEVHERLDKVLALRALPRHQMEVKSCCPTPNYDQAVFKYHWKDENLEYIWSIPCRDACFYLKNNALYVVPEERQLLNFVLDFDEGRLYQRMKLLNGEKPESNELIKE